MDEFKSSLVNGLMNESLSEYDEIYDSETDVLKNTISGYENLKQYIPSITEEDSNNIIIKNKKLYYIGVGENKEFFINMGYEIENAP